MALQFGRSVTLYTGINDSLQLLVRGTTGPDTLDAAYLLTPIAPAVILTAKPTQTPVRQPVACDVGERERQQLCCERRHHRGWLGRCASHLGRSRGDVQVRRALCNMRFAVLPALVGRSDGVGALRGGAADRAPVATPCESRVGQSVTLAWTSEGADSCVATGGRPGDGWMGTLRHQRAEGHQ